jgi:hypothetical protein
VSRTALEAAATDFLGCLAGGVARVARRLLLGQQPLFCLGLFGGDQALELFLLLARLLGDFRLAGRLGGEFRLAGLAGGFALGVTLVTCFDDGAPRSLFLGEARILGGGAELLQQRLLGGCSGALTVTQVGSLEAHLFSGEVGWCRGAANSMHAMYPAQVHSASHAPRRGVM